MADKITKYLNKLSNKDRVSLLEAMFNLSNLNFSNMDIIKLSGQKDKYRIRVGSHRIIFFIKNNEAYIEEIKKRDENTY